MNFNPTHMFRGLELQFQGNDPFVYGLAPFRDADGAPYYLSLDVVTKIPPKPQPGEVWKYVNPDDPDPFRLVLVTLDFPPSFVNEEGDTVPFAGNDHLMNFVKVLNADGTPA